MAAAGWPPARVAHAVAVVAVAAADALPQQGESRVGSGRICAETLQLRIGRRAGAHRHRVGVCAERGGGIAADRDAVAVEPMPLTITVLDSPKRAVAVLSSPTTSMVERVESSLVAVSVKQVVVVEPPPGLPSARA